MCTYLDDLSSKEDTPVLVSIKGLEKSYTIIKDFFSPKVVIRAVDSITFDIKSGDTLGLIGESGSGKTTTGELIANLIEADQGSIVYQEIDILKSNKTQMRRLRKDIQIIFQQGKETLDPKSTVGELIGSPLKIHRVVPPGELDREIGRLLDSVGLSGKDRHKFSYQLSGGQQQRVGIARAIASRPRFVICDEPVSALDVSVQGQILNLLKELKEELNLTYLFISHDLKVVKHISNRIAVMYKGKIVEIGDTNEVIQNPCHEYTRKLVLSML